MSNTSKTKLKTLRKAMMVSFFLLFLLFPAISFGADYIYSGSFDDTVRKIDSSGNEIWKFEGHIDNVLTVAVDSDGYVYSGSADETIRKIDPSGNEVWKFEGHTNDVHTVAVDNDGYVYSGSVDETVRKIDPDGNEVWKFEGHTQTVFGVALDNDGYIYSVSSDITVRKIDPSGNEVWKFEEHTGTIYSIAVDNDGYVYSVSSDDTVRKIDPSGNEIWKFEGHTNTVYSIALDSDNYVYSGDFDDILIKIDPSGNEVWKFEGHTDFVLAVAVDSDGYVYSGSRDETIRKIDPSGNEVWKFEGHTDTVRSVAVFYGEEEEELPDYPPIHGVDSGETGIELWKYGGDFDEGTENWIFSYQLERVKDETYNWQNLWLIDPEVHIEQRDIIFYACDDYGYTNPIKIEFGAKSYWFEQAWLFTNNYKIKLEDYIVSHEYLSEKLDAGECYNYYLKFERDDYFNEDRRRISYTPFDHFTYSFDDDPAEMGEEKDDLRDTTERKEEEAETRGYLHSVGERIANELNLFLGQFLDVFPFSWISEILAIVKDAKEAGGETTYPELVIDFDIGGHEFQIDYFPMEDVMAQENFMESGHNVGELMGSFKSLMALVIWVTFGFVVIKRTQRFVTSVTKTD